MSRREFFTKTLKILLFKNFWLVVCHVEIYKWTSHRLPGISIVYIVYVLWKKMKKNHFEILGYFSQQILLQKQKVAGINLFVYAEAMWAFTCARASRGCLNLKTAIGRGRDRIRYNELRRENWTSRWFHTDYFNREYLFWTWLTSFKSRHFKLSIHIFLMYLRQVFAEIHVVLFTCLWREVTETEPAENAPCLFSLFFKSTLFLLLWLYTNKSRRFAVSNDTLFLSVLSKFMEYFFVLFAVINKIRDRPHWCGLWPQGVKTHFNMPIKILQTFSGSYNFIKIKQNKMINVYFQEPSSICESEFKACRLPYTGRSVFWDF